MRQRGLGILNTISELLDDPKLKQTGRLPEYSHSTSKNPDKILEDWMQPNQSVIEPIEYPLVNLSDFEGRGYVLGESDRAISNRMLEGIGNNPLSEPIELNTGSNFMFHNPQVWSSGGSVITRMMNQAKALKEQTGQNPIMLPRLLGPQGVDFDKNIATTMIRYNQANAPKSTLKEQDDIIRKHIPNWRNANDAQSMQAFYDAPAVTRKKLQIDLDKLKNMDGLSLGNARLAITNPDYIHSPNQTLPAVAEIDVGRGTSKNTNINYPVGFHGEGLGLLSTPLTARQLTEPAEGFFNKAGDKVGEKHVEYYIKQANPSGILTREKLNAMRDAGIKFKSGVIPTAATLGTAAMSLLGSEEADAAIIPKLAQTTQRANTVPTAKAADKYLTDQGATGKSLDYGAGFGINAKAIGFDDTFEPFADDAFKPTYTSAADIPENTYGKVVSTNVLNVIPPDARAEAIQNIGSILEPNGMAVIQTRSASAVNELKKSKTAIPQDEPASFLTSKGSYQKGFTRDELQNEVQGILGDNFEVTKIPAKDIPNGSAISVKKLRGVTLPSAVAATGLLGGQEEAEASGLVAAVPAIARKLLDDPNAPKKNTPQGWANYLKNNGAKPNEIEKYNLDLIDSKRPLDKEEVSQYLLDNEYKFGRSLHTEQPNQTDVDVMREQYKDYFDEKMSTYGATTADVNEEIGFALDEKQPLFRTDRSSGDITNYRNQVLTDPSGEQIDKYIGMNSQRSTQLSGELRELHTAIKNDSFILDNVDGNLVKVPMEEMKARQTQKQIEKARLEKLRNQAENRLFVESSHFTEPNAIGHVRTTDRVNSFDPRTGKKTEYRLMEEVQSDWVQRAENPDYGIKDVEAMDNLYDAMYESKVNQYKAMANASPDEREGIFNAFLAEQADISRRLDSMNRSKEGLALVPQPPVAKPHIPLVNQTIIDAVDDNMDGVGIVTGDTQLAAKDQFQFINDISWKSVKSEGGATEILFDFSGITNRQGDVGTVHQQLSMDIKKDLEAFRTMMPKGAADQIISDVKAAVERGDDSGVMSNFNTQVEGKKLRPYYNKTLRKHLEQIGKQYGVKVERRSNTDEYRIDDLDEDGFYAVLRDGDTIAEFDDIDEAKQYLSKQQMGADDHFYLPFTDEMKADVKKNGLKMFSTIGLTPVAIDAMRSNVAAEDERMRVVYDDTDTQREENRAAIEDMLARDAKTRRREELGDTLTGLLDAPKTALNLAGDVITDTIGGAFQVLPELGVRAVESAVPSLKGTGLGDRFAEGFSSLYKSKPRNRKEEMIRNQVTSNLMDALAAAAPYAQEAYTSGGLLGAPSLQDIVQTAKSGYEQLPEGYVKENLLPAAGYTAAGILSVPYLFGRAPVKAATENMMPQGLLN